jgi:hypothetical protein
MARAAAVISRSGRVMPWARMSVVSSESPIATAVVVGGSHPMRYLK